MAQVLKCNGFGITLINSNSFNSIQFKNRTIDSFGMAMVFRKSTLRWDLGSNKLHFYNIVKSTSRMEPYLDLLFTILIELGRHTKPKTPCILRLCHNCH